MLIPILLILSTEGYIASAPDVILNLWVDGRVWVVGTF